MYNEIEAPCPAIAGLKQDRESSKCKEVIPFYCSSLANPAARLVDELKSSRCGEWARWSIFMIIESVGECKSFPQHNQTDVWILDCPYCRLIRTGSSLAVKRRTVERKAQGAESKRLKSSLAWAWSLLPFVL